MDHKLIITSNDVQVITSYSIGHCRRILQKIRRSLGKQPSQKVTIFEFAKYMAIPVELIIEKLKAKKHKPGDQKTSPCIGKQDKEVSKLNDVG